jgi:acyl-CoA reductase-like NAD-dependent aldehyde dehydrogenase
MRNYELYSCGKFVSTETRHEVYNRYNEELFASTYLASEQLLDQTIEGGLQAKKACAALTAHEKYTALRFIADELEQNKKKACGSIVY